MAKKKSTKKSVEDKNQEDSLIDCLLYTSDAADE